MALESYYGVSSRAERNPAGNPAPALDMKRGDTGYWDVLERMGMDTVKNPAQCRNSIGYPAFEPTSPRMRKLISNALFDANGKYYETQGDAIGAVQKALATGGIDWKPENEHWEHVGYEETKRYAPIELPGGYYLHMMLYRMPSGKYELTAYADQGSRRGRRNPEYPSDIYDRASRPSFQGDLYDRAVGWESLGGRSARLIAFHPTEVLGSVRPSSTAGYQWVATIDRGTKDMNDASDAVEYVEVNAFGKVERDLGESRKNILRALGGERRNPLNPRPVEQVYVSNDKQDADNLADHLIKDHNISAMVLERTAKTGRPFYVIEVMGEDLERAQKVRDDFYDELVSEQEGRESNPAPLYYFNYYNQDTGAVGEVVKRFDSLDDARDYQRVLAKEKGTDVEMNWMHGPRRYDADRPNRLRRPGGVETYRESNPSVFGSDEELIEQAREQGDKGATATRRRDAAGARFFREHYNKWLRLVSGDDAALKAKLEAAYREGYSNVSPTYGNPEGPAPANDMMVAKAILAQLGGHKFLAMTGASHLVGGANSLSMKIGRNSKGINHVMITLDPSDTYTLKFYAVRGAVAKIKDEVEGVYADGLQEAFTRATGMYTSMGTMGRERNPEHRSEAYKRGQETHRYHLFNEHGISYGHVATEEEAKWEGHSIAKARKKSNDLIGAGYDGYAIVEDRQTGTRYKFLPEGRIVQQTGARPRVPLPVHTMDKRNPADLSDAAFDSGKFWATHGSHESGVSNANVRHYGFVKWFNDLTPTATKGWNKSKLERAFNEGYAIGKRQSREDYGGPRRNPEGPAADMYASFHGTDSTEVVEVTEEEHYHSHLASLGELRELKVATFNKKDVTITFAKSGTTKLCSNEEGTQLYIVGGDQSLDLKAMGLTGDQIDKDFVALGVLHELTYQTKKEFHKFQLVDYYHELGEETGYQPILTYDTMNKSLSISGGEYKIKPEGIVN